MTRPGDTSRRHPPRALARRGLTLIEVIVAMLIASAGFGLIMTSLAQARRSAGRVAAVDRELALARTLIEESFVNALRPEDATRPAAGVRRWAGATNGIPWTVEVRSGVTQGITIERPSDQVGVTAGEQPTGLMPMDILTVEAGRVRLSTVTW